MPSYGAILKAIKERMLGGYSGDKVMIREGQLLCGDKMVYVGKALLDTGASGGNYIGEAMVAELKEAPREPCSHRVTLGDGKTQIHITQCLTLDVALYDEDGKLQPSTSVELYIMPSLGKEIIIGLPEILGNFYEYFIGVLERARARQPAVRLERLYELYGLCKDALCSDKFDGNQSNSTIGNSI